MLELNKFCVFSNSNFVFYLKDLKKEKNTVSFTIELKVENFWGEKVFILNHDYFTELLQAGNNLIRKMAGECYFKDLITNSEVAFKYVNKGLLPFLNVEGILQDKEIKNFIKFKFNTDQTFVTRFFSYFD